jgi:hypothetical protein
MASTTIMDAGHYANLDNDFYKGYLGAEVLDRMDVDLNTIGDGAEDPESVFELDSEGEALCAEEQEWEDPDLAAQAAEEDREEDDEEESEETTAFIKAEGEDARIFADIRLVCLSYGIEQEGRFDPYRQVAKPGDDEAYYFSIGDYTQSMYELKTQALRCVFNGWGKEAWHKMPDFTHVNPDAFWLYDGSTGERIQEGERAYNYLKRIWMLREAHLEATCSWYKDRHAEETRNKNRRGGYSSSSFGRYDKSDNRDYNVEAGDSLTIFLVITKAGVQLPQVYEHVRIVHTPAEADIDSSDEEEGADDQEAKERALKAQVVYELYNQNIWALTARRLRRHLAAAKPLVSAAAAAETASPQSAKKKQQKKARSGKTIKPAPEDAPQTFALHGTDASFAADNEGYLTDDGTEPEETKVELKACRFEKQDRQKPSPAMEALLDYHTSYLRGLRGGKSYVPLVFLGLVEGGSLHFRW